MIHIGRAGNKLGSFSEFEVRQGLASGRFFPTDLGWKEGMENWAPLSQFTEFSPAPPMPPLPDEEAEAPSPLGEVAESGLPWDERRERGVFPAFLETAWLVLLTPSQAFRRMRTTGSLAGPLLYNLAGGWVGLIASGIYAVLIAGMQGAPPANLPPMEALFYLTPERAMMELKLFIFLGPIMVTVSSLACAAVAHLCLMLAGGANKPYHVTLRVFCFSYGTTQLLQLVPLCGSLAAPAWVVVCCVMGLAAAHGTTRGRSVVTMGLFLVAFFACCLGTLAMALGAAGVSMNH